MPKPETLEELLKSEFSGSIRAITDKDFENFGISRGSFVAKAKTLLPDDFEPSDNIDVLPVVFNLAKVNQFNKNGDGISTIDAMEMVKRFANKPINIEHKKQKIVGHIINASFSDKEPDFQENNIEDFKDRTDPFFINAAGVIYRHIYPKLAALVSEASDEESQEYQSISTSWEVAFKDWAVGKGSPILSECTIISDAEEKLKYKKFIKKFGGKGVDENGVPVNRLIIGNTIPLGGALTYNPAADVKGVYVIDEDLIYEEVEKDKKNDEEEENDANMQNISQNNSLISKNIVKIKKFKDTFNMNEKQFEQFLQKLEQSVASVTKEESQAKSIGLIFKDALMEQGESWKSQVQAAKEEKEQLQKDMDTLKASFEISKKELDEVKAEIETKTAVELFNSRMNFLEDKYEFSEKELQFVTAEVKSISSDEKDFDNYKEKVSTLFSHKLKEAIASQKQEVEAKIEEEVAKRLAGKAATETSTASTAAENGKGPDLETETATATIVNNNGQSSNEESLIQKLKQSFSVEVSK